MNQSFFGDKRLTFIVLWQKNAQGEDTILAMVDGWKSLMSTESCQNAVQGLMQACRCALEGVSLVQLPEDQIFDKNQVI
jgi:hypothetical protein